MLSATIFNVVHGSFVDGWGIRTTIFFKGCPLRCKWCCNPESQEALPQLRIIKEDCSSCGRCIPFCPQNALSLNDDGITADRALCNSCGACVPLCRAGALNIWGIERTLDDLFSECMQDRTFYDTSGGGVTFSGGEPTMQAEFCLALMEKCHEAGITVAVDTCGHTITSDGIMLLSLADLVLFDIKGLKPESHKTNTGIDSHIIQNNLNLLEKLGQNVIIRYPVIPGYNLDEAEMIARHLTKYQCIRRVDLIPYHRYGSVKYEQLGRSYAMEESDLSANVQNSLLEMFLSQGLPAQLGG